VSNVHWQVRAIWRALYWRSHCVGALCGASRDSGAVLYAHRSVRCSTAQYSTAYHTAFFWALYGRVRRSTAYTSGL
jgi:hypothetical protein